MNRCEGKFSYNEVWSFRQLLTLAKFMQAELCCHVIIRCLVTDAPSHVYHLEFVTLLETVLFDFRVRLFHPIISLIFCIYRIKGKVVHSQLTTSLQPNIEYNINLIQFFHPNKG